MGEQVTDPHEAAARLRELFDGARSAVFFGGAGVSTASGIPDFRSEDGLYRQRFAYPPEEMLSAGFLREHPEEFFDFYRERMVCPDARPNRAHAKLAELECEGHLAAVVTQNIDGLHQAAGSRRVLELHGSCTETSARAAGRRTPRSGCSPRRACRAAIGAAAS